jgi:hypothetical protein
MLFLQREDLLDVMYGMVKIQKWKKMNKNYEILIIWGFSLFVFFL